MKLACSRPYQGALWLKLVLTVAMFSVCSFLYNGDETQLLLISGKYVCDRSNATLSAVFRKSMPARSTSIRLLQLVYCLESCMRFFCLCKEYDGEQKVTGSGLAPEHNGSCFGPWTNN